MSHAIPDTSAKHYTKLFATTWPLNPNRIRFWHQRQPVEVEKVPVALPDTAMMQVQLSRIYVRLRGIGVFESSHRTGPRFTCTP